jgi:predicted N-acyltransferase
MTDPKEIDIKVHHSFAEIPEQEWRKIVHSSRFFLSYEYLGALSIAFPAIEYKFITAYQNNVIVGVASYQVIDFFGTSLYGYIPKVDNLLTRMMKMLFKKIHVKLVTVGNLISTGEKGWKFLTDDATAIDSVLRGVNLIKENIPHTTGSFVNKVATQEYENIYKKYDYSHLEGEDEMHFFLNSKYATMKDYESAIHSKYRVRMKKIFAVSEGVEIRKLDAEYLKSHKSEINFLFDNVVEHAKFKLFTIDVQYFIKMKEAMPNLFFIDGYFYKGKLVSFVTYFLRENDLDVHYIGLDYESVHEIKLYNRILYDMLRIGIENDAEMICFGRTSHEIKSTIGAEPEKIHSYLKIHNKVYNLFLPFFLKKLKPIQWTQRSPFK